MYENSNYSYAKLAQTQISAVLLHYVSHLAISEVKHCKKSEYIGIKSQIMLLIEDRIKLTREAKEETYRKKAKKNRRH